MYCGEGVSVPVFKILLDFGFIVYADVDAVSSTVQPVFDNLP